MPATGRVTMSSSSLCEGGRRSSVAPCSCSTARKAGTAWKCP